MKILEIINKVNRSQKFKSDIQKLIKNNNTNDILDMMDEEVIQNYLLKKKIKRIQEKK